MMNNIKYYIKEYEDKYKKDIIDFFEKCLPESGRIFEKYGRHNTLLHIEEVYDYFICMFNEEDKLIGTCAVKKIDAKRCELKCVYLYKEYYGKGLGSIMCNKVIQKAKENGYEEMYLETISKTSSRAIKMYEKFGFKKTEKYHEALFADKFMKLNL